jgi:hypothetical protein
MIRKVSGSNLRDEVSSILARRQKYEAHNTIVNRQADDEMQMNQKIDLTTYMGEFPGAIRKMG